MAWYNDNDPYCAEWLRNLAAAGYLPAGTVDQRSIVDIEPDDLVGYRQCHFFAGIGGWPYALTLAGWPDDREVWTGSCPCQPFSAAGRQGGIADERHLWPQWFRLIRECRPDTIFGEQVEGAVGFGWIDRVFADLEAEGYACGTAVLGAHSVGAPHIRRRLFWVAVSRGHRFQTSVRQSPMAKAPRQQGASAQRSGGLGWAGAVWARCLDGKARLVEPAHEQMADGISRCLGRLRPGQQQEVIDAACRSGLGREVLSALRQGHDAAAVWQSLGGCVGFPKATILFAALCQHSRELGNLIDCASSRLASECESGLRGLRTNGSPARSPSRWQLPQQCAVEFADAVHSLPFNWSSLAEFTGSPLASGVPARVGRLRAYGNAIVPQAAAEFIAAIMANRLE